MRLFFSLMALTLLVGPVFSDPIEKSRLFGNYQVQGSDGNTFDAEINEVGIVFRNGPGFYSTIDIFNGAWGDFLLSKVFGPYIVFGRSGRVDDATEFTVFLKDLSVEDLEAGRACYLEVRQRHGNEEKTIMYQARKQPAIIPSHANWLESEY